MTKWALANRLGKEVIEDDYIRDAADEVDFAAHSQFISGTEFMHANVLTDEIQNVNCEAARLRLHLAMTISQYSGPIQIQPAGQYSDQYSNISQYSGILTGATLDLPVCRRVEGNGFSLLVQQCKTTKWSVRKIMGVRTRCGYEPMWTSEEQGLLINYTLASDVFTRKKFSNCSWSSGLTNFNGKTVQYKNGVEWVPIEPRISVQGLGKATHFEETLDNEAEFLNNIESAFEQKGIETL